MRETIVDSPDEAATAALASRLARLLPDGAVVALEGPLGAGKTRLVQGIAAALGVEPGTAVSPTFVLVQQYEGRRRIVHVDAYRMRDEDEFLALGGEELLASGAIVLIEWAERIGGCLPRERLRVSIRETGPTSRRFEIASLHGAYDALVDQLARPPAGVREAQEARPNR